jgi:hypothetical protein
MAIVTKSVLSGVINVNSKGLLLDEKQKFLLSLDEEKFYKNDYLQKNV